jgi:hypothetical protein
MLAHQKIIFGLRKVTLKPAPLLSPLQRPSTHFNDHIGWIVSSPMRRERDVDRDIFVDPVMSIT